ncbi:hypothetical protein A9Q77_00500 [Marinomonas sp. 42_23_T18]|nr:hypothetical protein A9Q77_00500 [Marinomonas sp. 42_23_T18]
MTYVIAKKIAMVSTVALSMTACSIVDKADDYQLSRSNNTELVVPDGSVVAQDSLVIPNENEISNISDKTEFETPALPESYLPLADLAVSWEDDIMWVETALDIDTSKVVVKNFLSSLYGEGNPIDESTDTSIVSMPIGAQDQGALLSLYYNITRLYPDRTVYQFPLVAHENGTKIGFQHRVVSKDQNKVLSYSDWLSPIVTDKDYSVGLQLISAVSRESLEQETKQNAKVGSSDQVWLSNAGQYVLKMNASSMASDVAILVEQSDLYLISRDPLELAFVTEGEVTKVGDLKPVTLPPTTEGGKETLLLNVRYRNLNGVVWQKRVYPVDLVQRAEGLFVEVDTSATEYPDVVSYRIMSALKN